MKKDVFFLEVPSERMRKNNLDLKEEKLNIGKKFLKNTELDHFLVLYYYSNRNFSWENNMAYCTRLY